MKKNWITRKRLNELPENEVIDLIGKQKFIDTFKAIYRNLQTKTPKELYAFLKERQLPENDINLVADLITIDDIHDYPGIILHLKNPTFEMKREAVSKCPALISHEFLQESDELKMLAVSRQGNTLPYIWFPTEEMKYAVIKNYGGFLKTAFPNPTEEQFLIALDTYGEIIKDIPNPTEEMRIKAVQRKGSLIEFISNPSYEVQKEAVKNDFNAFDFIPKITMELVELGITFAPNIYSLERFPQLPERLYKIAVTREPYAIKGIKNPSLELQKISVTKNYVAVIDIENPFPEILSIAFEGIYKEWQEEKTSSDHMLSVLFRKNFQPTEDETIKLVEIYQGNFMDLKDWVFSKKQSMKVLEYAFSLNPYIIKYLPNPSFEQWMDALKRNGSLLSSIPENQIVREYIEISLYSCGKNIQLLKKPSEELQIRAVKSNPDCIQYIENPSEAVQEEAVKKDPETILLLSNPSEKVQIIAVTQKPELIVKLTEPSDDVCLAAINSNPQVAQYIKYPSKMVRDYYLNLEKEYIIYLD